MCVAPIIIKKIHRAIESAGERNAGKYKSDPALDNIMRRNILKNKKERNIKDTYKITSN